MATRLSSPLLRELKRCVGEKNCLTNPGDLHVYSFDSALDRATPSAVVLPGNLAQLTQTIQVLARHKQPYVARGAATSLCGGPVPLNGAVVVALSRLKKIGKIDKAKKNVTVEPGVVNLRLQQTVAQEGLFYAPDPGSQKACTIGGNVATNAGGPHCLKYGVTSNSVVGLEIIQPDGKPMKLGADDPGYDILGFFVGSEGTLGTASRITLQLHPRPKFIRTMVVSFHSIEEAIHAVTDIIAGGILPATLEAMDKIVVQAVEAFVHAGYSLKAEAVLLIEVDGDSQDDLEQQAEKIKFLCEAQRAFEFRYARSEAERMKLWEGRRGSYAAMARLAPNVLVEDGAVPRTKLPEALKAIQQIAEDARLRVALLFHAGDGNLHPQIIFDERNAEQTRVVKEAGMKMLKACVDLGGTISGEHGIGIDKREAMKWLFTRETLSLFRRLKNTFDPLNLCNPDKLIPLVSQGRLKKNEQTEDIPVPTDPMGQVSPESEDQLLLAVRQFAKEKKLIGIQGHGTRMTVSENIVIRTSHLNKILDFDRGNFTVVAQAGVALAELKKTVEAAKQYLWVAGEGSVGGVVATNASVSPPLRDQILGMRVLLPNGDIVKFGAKTMKNVAGYDAAKLLIGSWGTLGFILDVTFRLFPYPAPELLQRNTIEPFVFRDIHKKIKHAFDPNDTLSVRTMAMTIDDIKKLKSPRRQ